MQNANTELVTTAVMLSGLSLFLGYLIGREKARKNFAGVVINEAEIAYPKERAESAERNNTGVLNATYEGDDWYGENGQWKDGGFAGSGKSRNGLFLNAKELKQNSVFEEGPQSQSKDGNGLNLYGGADQTNVRENETQNNAPNKKKRKENEDALTCVLEESEEKKTKFLSLDQAKLELQSGNS